MNLCPDCGADLALVGRTHRCVANKSRHMANSEPDVANALTTDDLPALGHGSTYRYRNRDERRAYMRDYMRKRRGSG